VTVYGMIMGVGRSPEEMENRVTHLYAGTFSEPGWPMCRRGWNRDRGTSYSIWRENVSEMGICQICERRAREGRKPVPPRDVREAYPEFYDSEEAA